MLIEINMTKKVSTPIWKSLKKMTSLKKGFKWQLNDNITNVTKKGNKIELKTKYNGLVVLTRAELKKIVSDCL